MCGAADAKRTMSDAAAAAAAAKAAGDAAFKRAEYAAAVEQYTLAIEADATNHVLYSNRSAAYAKSSDYKAALRDANECLRLNRRWARGHGRRAAAYVGLRNWRAALSAYEAGLELEPDHEAMRAEAAAIRARLAPGGGAAAGGGGRARE